MFFWKQNAPSLHPKDGRQIDHGRFPEEMGERCGSFFFVFFEFPVFFFGFFVEQKIYPPWSTNEAFFHSSHSSHFSSWHLLHSKDFEFRQGKVKEMHESMRRLWDAIPSICVYLSQRTLCLIIQTVRAMSFLPYETDLFWMEAAPSNGYVRFCSEFNVVFPFKPGSTSSDGSAAASNSFSVFAASPSGGRSLASKLASEIPVKQE